MRSAPALRAPCANDWQPAAGSPRTRLLPIPHQHPCVNFEATELGSIAGTSYLSSVVEMHAGAGNELVDRLDGAAPHAEDASGAARK